MSGPIHPVVTILNAALELPPAERPGFLDRACGGDNALRQEVEALLAAHEQASDFLEAQPAGVKVPQTVRVTLPPMEKPGDRIGRYKLLEQIGEGGFGAVYMAEQMEPVQRKVALKVIKAGMDTKEVIARFEAERQALALMDHPNIARVLDAGATEAGRPYFVMELVKGIPLTEFCDLKKLSAAERLELFMRVCQAVQHAHQKGIIHRDLKPSNVLVTLHDGEPVPKVIDFGVAKALGQKLTEKTLFTGFAHLIGTPAYMSPEQAELSGLDIDTRSDIYSLGVLLYELLTGVTPFGKEALAKAALDEVRRMIRETEPPKPSKRLTELVAADVRRLASSSEANRASLRRVLQQKKELIHQVRGDLDWIVMKCLEKDRRRRYETANGLASDLRRHLEHEPVVARPPSRLYEFQKSVKRHKFGFAAAGAVMLALAAGVVVSSWQAVRATRAEREQARLRQLAERKEKKSQQVSQFLKDMLEGVGPSVALGRDTTMLREILDQTAERVGKDLKDQPEVEAELRSILGNVYRTLYAAEQAEAMHREALRLRRSVFGETNPLVAASLNDLARVLIYRSQSDPSQADLVLKAETLLREALELRLKLLGRENPDTALTIYLLASALQRQRKFEEAEKLHQDALALRRKLFGNQHRDVASSLNNLGWLYRAQQKYEEAEVTVREALALQKTVLPAEHPDICDSLYNLCGVLTALNKSDEAETAARGALAMRRKLYGEDDAVVYRLVNTLVTLWRKRGNVAEAESLLKETAKRQREASDDPSQAKVATLGALAYFLRQEGKHEESEAAYRELLDLQISRQGRESSAAASAMAGLAMQLARSKPLEAEALAREALAIQERHHGHDDVRVVKALHHLAESLEAQGREPEAEEAWREGIAIDARLKQMGRPPSEDPFWMHSGLGHVLYRQGKFSEAEQHFREAAALRSPLKDDLYLNSVLHLANTIRAQGRLSEAVDLFREAGERADPNMLNGLAWPLATSPRAANRDGAAAVLFAEKAVTATARTNSQILDTLAAAYAEAGQFANAVRVQKEAITLIPANQMNLREEFESRLRLFESNAPYREYGHEPHRLQAAGKLAEAESLLREQLSMHRKMFAADHPAVAGTLANLALVLVEQQKFTQAEPLARECVRIREQKLPDHWSTFNAQSLLGGSLLGQNEYEKAEPLLVSGYEGMKQREDQIPAGGKARLEEARERLVQLYDAWGKPNQAAEWRARLGPGTTAKND